MAFSDGKLQLVSTGQPVTTNRAWMYINASDTASTILASGYFNVEAGRLNKNDIIFLIASDENSMIEVTSNSRAIPVTTAYYSHPSTSIPLEYGRLLIGDSNNMGVGGDFSPLGTVPMGNGTIVTNINKFSHLIIFGGEHTYGGGGTSTTISVPTLSATEFVQVTLSESTNVVSLKAEAATNQINVTFSADPGAGTVLTYQVFRTPL
jgi:hypothetical protein